MATVVAVQRPTSARPGARGIIHRDGSIEGWVGGSCAQPIVIREALRSLQTEEPRLLRLSADPGREASGPRAEGAVEYVMTCHSGGTLEIYVEPHVPQRRLLVAGATPIAQALVQLGNAMGYRASLVDPLTDPHAIPDGIELLPDANLATLDAGSAPYIVVASQGQWDEEALAAALRRDDGAYVALIASPTRARAVRSWLAEEGLPPDRVAAMRAPAGLDLGATTPEEVAVSILAELIMVRRGRAGAAGAEASAPQETTPGEEGEIVLLDPVCGMTVDRDDARHIAEHDGIVYAFCSVGCRSRFRRDPEAFLAKAEA